MKTILLGITTCTAVVTLNIHPNIDAMTIATWGMCLIAGAVIVGYGSTLRK